MNTIKKIVSGMAILAILLMISITNAATPTAVINTAAKTITLTNAGNNANELLTTLVVKRGVTVLTAGTDYTTTANTATAGTIVVTLTAATAGKYQVSYVTATTGTAGSVYVVNDNSNDVVITATVVPVLTMALGGNAVSFGNLNIVGDNASNTDTVITVSTNATAGLSISTTTTGGDTGTTASALGSAGTVNTISPIAAKTLVTGLGGLTTEYFGADLVVTSNAAGVPLVADAAFSTGNANKVTGILATTTGPTDTAVLNVKYHAGITSITEAGNYSATVVYSVTGTF